MLLLLCLLLLLMCTATLMLMLMLFCCWYCYYFATGAAIQLLMFLRQLRLLLLLLLHCCGRCFAVAAVMKRVVRDRKETKEMKTERGELTSKKSLQIPFIILLEKGGREETGREALFSSDIHHPKQDTRNGLYKHTSTTSHYK